MQGLEGQKQCQECYPGTYGVVPGQVKCLDCEPGRFTDFHGGDSCLKCPEMMFTGAPGSPACDECARGFYTKDRGADKCHMCTPGQFSWQRLADATNITGEAVCDVCPEGAVCIAGDVVIVKAGYWRSGEVRGSPPHQCQERPSHSTHDGAALGAQQSRRSSPLSRAMPAVSAPWIPSKGARRTLGRRRPPTAHS